MRDVGKEPEVPPSPGRKPAHSRVTSRSSFTARQPSASISAPALGKPGEEKKKKNALVKESEYGVHGIKVPLTEVAVKAEEVWGPALGGREKEETLKSILTSVEKHRGLFEIGSAIQDGIRRKDHEVVVEEYTRARKYAEDARYIVEQANYSKTPLTDVQIHQIIVTARMWSDVEHQVEAFKRDAWKRLTSTHFSKQENPHQSSTEDAKSDQYMELISIMLELGVEDNPIWVWLLSRYEHLKSRVAATCERNKVEIEILRRYLANSPKPGLKLLLKHLRSVPTNKNAGVEPAKLDSVKVVEFWEHQHASMSALLGINGGLLGELIEFWEIAQSFVQGRAQRTLPMGFNNQSSVHHKLTSENVEILEAGMVELINIIREVLFSFFAEPPVEDISMLFSPIPPSPASATVPQTPLSASLSPTVASKFRFDKNNVPPPSPGRGEAWEKYAFWPPNSNALSGAHYLSKLLTLIGTAANELASFQLSGSVATPRVDESLRQVVGSVRERCIQAVCAAWNTDAENIKVLEDWSRDADRKDITTMPNRFLAVQSFLLNNLQKIMYIEASTKTNVDVIVPPSSKLLQMVRSQFVMSLYRTLSGMVECAEKGRRALGKEFEIKDDDLAVNEEEGEDGTWGKVDSAKQVSLLFYFHTVHENQFLTFFPVHPPPPDPVQYVLLPNRNHPSTPQPLRTTLLRAAHRRNQPHSRRALPARLAALPLLHETALGPHRHHHRSRYHKPEMGAGARGWQIRCRPRPLPLRLLSAARPGHRAHGSQHHLSTPNVSHPPRALRIHHGIAHRDLQKHARLQPRQAHAGDPRRRVHGPDAGVVHDGEGEPGPDGYLSGAGCEDG
jgi:exocyst complex component 2